MVFIGGKHMEDIVDFSTNFLDTINMIKGGKGWINWALKDPNLSVHFAQSEQDLLLKVQSGLHETPFLSNQLLTIHIDTAMSLGDEDLTLLAGTFAQSFQKTPDVAALIDRLHWVTHLELKSLGGSLDKYKLTDFPSFLHMGFVDQLKLFRLLQSVRNTPITQEAFGFAKDKAATVAEFVDYARFYLNCVQYQLKGKVEPSGRQDKVEAIYAGLNDLCNSLLYVTNIGDRQEGSDFTALLKDFVMTSKFIGYSLKATAMANLSQNLSVLDGTELDLKNGIDTFMTAVKQHVTNGSFVEEPLPQEGWPRRFKLLSSNFQVVLNLSESGNISLSNQTHALSSSPQTT